MGDSPQTCATQGKRKPLALKVPRTAPSLKTLKTQNPKADCKAHTFFTGLLGTFLGHCGAPRTRGEMFPSFSASEGNPANRRLTPRRKVPLVSAGLHLRRIEAQGEAMRGHCLYLNAAALHQSIFLMCGV